MLDGCDHIFGALVVRVIVVIPPGEARLVLAIVHLAVMN